VARRNVFTLDDCRPRRAARSSGEVARPLQRAFGYTDEDLRIVVGPMADSGKEPWAPWAPTRRSRC
jgi:glutamate synthase (NADPH/NADH) large chain